MYLASSEAPATCWLLWFGFVSQSCHRLLLCKHLPVYTVVHLLKCGCCNTRTPVCDFQIYRSFPCQMSFFLTAGCEDYRLAVCPRASGSAVVDLPRLVICFCATPGSSARSLPVAGAVHVFTPLGRTTIVQTFSEVRSLDPAFSVLPGWRGWRGSPVEVLT